MERHAAELNALKEELNKSVRDYNNCVKRFREKKRKLDQMIDRNQVREDCLKEREKLMEDFEDNMTLSELQDKLLEEEEEEEEEEDAPIEWVDEMTYHSRTCGELRNF